MEFLKNPNFDFLGKTKYFVGASVLVVLAGLAYMLSTNTYLGRNAKGYGVEFSGGTQLIVKFQNAPDVERIRTAVEQAAPGAVIQTYDKPEMNQVLIRLAGTEEDQAAPAPTTPVAPGEDRGTTELGAAASRVTQALASGYSGNPVLETSSEIVGPVVGAELRRKAVQLTVLGLLFQLIYIAIRFKGAVWGAAATIAVLHDVLVTLAFLALFRYEITLNVIAALLTLVGYSVNDTIVIFDRAREIIRHNRKDSLRKILNDSVNLTLTRTLISNGTTFLSVLALFLFGGEVLRGFGFTMVIGILVGTYSTIYIASPLVAWWSGRRASLPPGATAARAAAI
jgi:preprotein translocase subunit SecF